MSANSAAIHALRKAGKDFSWEATLRLPYKEEGAAPFKAISRQTLFSDPRMAGELRYFEIAPGGYSTLERHAHMHGVVVLRGGGQCLIGTAVNAIRPHDLVMIEPWTWHQFRAGPADCLGFLCLVNRERDKPQLPQPEDLALLRAIPEVARFLDGG
ncbi:MAG TPA: cupin domain-containing protein [Methylocella sp.]|nr:cupin domain-containing protein [Methylocella sp.]